MSNLEDELTRLMTMDVSDIARRALPIASTCDTCTTPDLCASGATFCHETRQFIMAPSIEIANQLVIDADLLRSTQALLSRAAGLLLPFVYSHEEWIHRRAEFLREYTAHLNATSTPVPEATPHEH